MIKVISKFGNYLSNKCENLQDEINRLKKHVHEWEKKYSDKEAEFLRYKEKENTRPLGCRRCFQLPCFF